MKFNFNPEMTTISLKDFIFYYLEIKKSALCYYLRTTLPNKENFKYTKQFKGIGKGKKAIVLALGPSINKLDILKIKQLQDKGYIVISGNGYVLSDMSKVVLPDYYVLSDPISFETTEETVKRIKEFVDINNIPVFMPIGQIDKKVYKNQIPFNDCMDSFCKNMNDITKRRGHPSLTLYKAIDIACYMEFEEIFICGFDNNWFKDVVVDENNVLYYEYDHCYQKHFLKAAEKNIAVLLKDVSTFMASLEKYESYNITNLDPNSLVDAFNKKHNLDIYKNAEKRETFYDAD